MSSPEKLAKTIEQLKTIEICDDTAAKKKELKVLLQTLVEFNCSSHLQTHKEFATYIGPSIDVLLKHYDSRESDIRLASDEGLCRIIKALLPIHSNRVLVELCRQIKRNDSPRVLKLAMRCFADLCHYARPQKQRAYLANLLNAIANIATRNEEILHESLAHFIQKVFTVMGVFAYENESKNVLKLFLQNLESESATIRRSAAISISAIISTNRKSEMLLSLVAEYLIDQILLNEEKPPKTSVIIGTLITLKMILPLYLAYFPDLKENQRGPEPKPSSSKLPGCTLERIVQMFELSIHYSDRPSDHNVLNAALELLLQLLKMRSFMLAIPALKSVNETLGTHISFTGLLKINSQWNVSPIPVAEELNLIEPEVALKTLDESNITDIADEIGEIASELDVSLATDKSGYNSTRLLQENGSTNENEELERSYCLNESEEADLVVLQSQDKETDIETLKSTKGYSPIINAARHLSYSFLVTAQKNQFKPDQIVRVSTKCLALNCLTLLGSVEPNVWNTILGSEDSIGHTGVLLYKTHDDPQIRGQICLMACAILQSAFSGFEICSDGVTTLLQIVEAVLKDRETAACRLALQGLRQLLPVALESPYSSAAVPLLLSLIDLSDNSYWLVKVDLIEVFSLLPWSALKYAFNESTSFNAHMFERDFIRNVLLRLIGDEDHRVRNAVVDSIPILIRSWTTEEDSPSIARVQRLVRDPFPHLRPSFSNVSLSINNLAEAYKDSECNASYINSLRYFVKLLFEEMAMSRSKFFKMGCVHALAVLSSTHRPTEYPEPYGCETDGSCDLLRAAVALMSSSPMMLDLSTHQALLALSGQLFAGCVKTSVTEENENVSRDCLFLSSNLSTIASDMLCHISRILNGFCCIIEDINPLSQVPKAPLVTLPSPSSLSPIRRKTKSTDSSVLGDKDEKVDKEELGRKWNKPTQLLSQQNLGHFASNPLYVKLYELLKATYSTCKLTFDAVTSDRLSNFIKSVLDTFGILLEVGTFHDVGKHSDELLNYLRWVIIIEPISCLYSVQQLLKSLFGANLASAWLEQSVRVKRTNPSARISHKRDNFNLYQTLGLSNDSFNLSILRKNSPSRLHERANHIVKFRTTVGKLGADKAALTAHIRLFEPMVIKALKLYTITSSAAVQKQVLDLLCELIHFCVNYCMLDAEQVFLNFVIQQFEFLEEGFIPDVEILLPSMFRFLSLLSYDRFHSKTIISVPRIMQLSGGLMAAGKDTQCYVIPTLEPMVEDLFLSRERMDDNSKELETQREVLINILLKLIRHHQVFPLLSTILIQVHSENVAKWRLLSKQICDYLIPQLYTHSLDLDSIDALAALQKLFSHLDPPVVHESLLGLLQVFALSQSDGLDDNAKFHRVLASRLIALEILGALFDEAFLLDCLNEFNLTYLVDRQSDPLNVTPTENFSAERILSSLLVATIKLAIVSWKRKVDQNRVSPFWIAWETDESFDVCLVLQLALLLHRIIHSGDFSVLKVAIVDELLREEKSSSLIQLSADLIPSNPVVFVKICALYPNEAKKFYVSKSHFTGFNGFIAKTGYFLVICDALAVEEMEDLVEMFADHILLLSEEPPVIKFLTRVLSYVPLSKKLLDYILQKPRETKARSMCQLLRNIESYQLGQKIGIEVFDLVVSKIAELDYPPVHYAFKNIVKQRLENEPSIQVINSCKKHLKGTSVYRFYTGLFNELSQSAFDGGSFSAVDKTFLLEYAFQRDGKKLDWEKVLKLLDHSDFEKLFNHGFYSEDILLGSYRLMPQLFHITLSNLFQELKKGESSARPNCKVALTIVRLLDELPPAETLAAFSAPEIVELSKFPLVFFSSMSSMQENIVLVYCSSKIISRLESVISSEWNKKENLELLLKSIEAFESFVVCLRNGKPLTHTGSLDVSKTNVDENSMRHALSLGRMVTLIEKEKNAISQPMLGYMKTVLVAFCRVPLFYSYVCIPPSVWSRDWAPHIRLDMENLTLDLPVIPSAYLHDEVIFEQFLFRIELIGWTNRQKFEEIWMTLLGIINLQNEEEFRPEEQASITLATCKAVRAVTMIIQKNLTLLSSKMKPKNDSKRIVDFMQSERGKKLSSLFGLLSLGATNPKANYLSHESPHRVIFNIIERNLVMGSPSKKQSSSPDSMTHVDVHSCVYFLKDLYSQWLQSPDIGCALLTEVLRSIYEISNFFTEVSSFEWMFECTTNILKFIQPDDPQCLESALAKCIIKSAAFIHLNSDSWELVRKHCEMSLNSQYIKTRASVLESLPYLLQRLTVNPDQTRAASLVNLIMDYTSKYLGTEKPGPEWHQSLLWTLTFYCGEHFPDMPFRSYLAIDFVVQCALNGLLENNFQSIGLHQQILQGIERLCILGVASLNKRKLIKMEVVNLIRNFDRESILLYALRALLALVYSDFRSKLYKPGVDPEAMLVAMEWVGSLFHRMKQGTDSDASIIGRVMPCITSDMFSPADILNRLLSEFISARPAVACSLAPTIFKVFATAREHNQQSLVFEWILFSLTNFTKAVPGTEAVAVWNILCFFTAASQNPWLHAIFPSVSRPMNANNVAEVEVFVASALDFRSQLGSNHQGILTSTFNSAKSRSPFFAAVGVALDKCENDSPPFL